jgi:hypothetical protein
MPSHPYTSRSQGHVVKSRDLLGVDQWGVPLTVNVNHGVLVINWKKLERERKRSERSSQWGLGSRE